MDVYWELIAALKKKEEFTYRDPQTSKALFVVDWYTRSFTNPVTGDTITSSGPWHTYEPEGDPKPSQTQQEDVGKVVLKSIVLLTDDSTMGRRTSTSEVASFIDVLCKSVDNLHKGWTAKEREKQPKEESDMKEKVKGESREKEEREEKLDEIPLFVLEEGQELALQLELDPSGKANFAAKIVDESGKNYETSGEWLEFILRGLGEQFGGATSSTPIAAMPTVKEGPVSFLFNFHQPQH